MHLADCAAESRDRDPPLLGTLLLGTLLLRTARPMDRGRPQEARQAWPHRSLGIWFAARTAIDRADKVRVVNEFGCGDCATAGREPAGMSRKSILTSARLSRKIEVTLSLAEHTMIRRTNKLVSLALVAAMSFLGIVPVTSACETTFYGCDSKQCCGACCTWLSAASSACCSSSAERQACQCSVDRERPAAPPERRNADERNDARRAECLAVVPFVACDESRTEPIEGASLLSSLPTSRRQAVLCRWTT